MTISLSRRLAAEFLGTAFLVAAVIGSGVMAERFANGNVALALLANAIATGAALIAQVLGVLAATFLFRWLNPRSPSTARAVLVW